MTVSRNQLTPEQSKLVDEAYLKAIKEWEASGEVGNAHQFFFLAGAQIGIKLADLIHRKAFQR